MKVKNIKKIGKHKVYDVSVDVSESYVLENGVICHNTGTIYASDTIIFIGKQQEKEGKELLGWNFILKSEKSRFVREKVAIPVLVKYKGGLSKYSGMFELAKDYGFIASPSKGWYEYKGNKMRRKEIEGNPEIMEEIITDEKFKQLVESDFML